MRGHTRAARRHTRAVAVRANFDRAKIAKPLQLSLESAVGVCLGLVWVIVWGVFGPARCPGGAPKSELSVGPSMTRATFGAPLAAIRGTKTAAGIRPRFWPAEMHCWAALPRRIGPANLTQMVFQKQHRGQLHRRCASEPREARKTDWTATPRVEPACTSDASITLPEPHLAGSTVEA